MARPTFLVAGYVCLDIHPAIPPSARMEGLLVPGKLVEIGAARVSLGGAVSNTGIALHRLGADVRLAGKLGDDDFGRMALSVFQSVSPSLADGMIIRRGGATSYSLCVQPVGQDRAFWCCPGENATFVSADLPPDLLDSSAHLHFGYPPLMDAIRREDGAELADLFHRAKESGLSTSLDMTPPDPASEAGRLDWWKILSRVLPDVDFFVPSLDETVFMVEPGLFDRVRAATAKGVPLGGLSPDEIRSIADRLIGLGAAGVMIKLGKEGAYLRTTADRGRLASCGRGLPIDPDAWLDRSLHARCFTVPVACTTGAGDTTIAGFLAAAGQGMGPAESLRMAVAVGSSLVEQPLGVRALPPFETIRDRFAASAFPRDPAPLFPSEV